MDHILLCSDNVAHLPPKIPYVCNDGFQYDNLGFLAYPDRVGVDTRLLGEDKLPHLALIDSAPFLQAWLWFGIMEEALGSPLEETSELPLWSSEHFVETIEGRSYVCTSNLGERISLVRGILKHHPHGKHYRERLSLSLHLASAFIRKILTLPSFPAEIAHLVNNEQPHLVFLVTLAAQILIQTLFDNFDISNVSNAENSEGLWPSAGQSLILVDNLLRHSGWCPLDIEKLPLDVSFRYHLSFYSQSPTSGELDHTGQGDCVCLPTQENNMSPTHTHLLCKCPDVEVPSSAVDESVSKGQILVFRFRKDGGRPRVLEKRYLDLSIEQRFPFVAISHVRKEGLGNDSRNSLPFCQLSLIQSLVDQLNTSQPDGVFFWMDTLCVPVNRHLRKVALQSVRIIFSQAYQVLVLDPPLYQHISSTSEEALIRIRYSTWKRRVWTLREGFLANNLVFRFANQLISLREMLHNFEASSKNDESKLMVLKRNDKLDPKFYVGWGIDVKLTQLMERFAADLDIWAKDSPGTMVFNSPEQDKFILYKGLRVGYLSAFRFRYFLENDECQQIPRVWRALLKIYDEMEIARETDSSTKQSIEQVFCRLRDMCTELLSTRSVVI
jgi:hypothetical protein